MILVSPHFAQAPLLRKHRGVAVTCHNSPVFFLHDFMKALGRLLHITIESTGGVYKCHNWGAYARRVGVVPRSFQARVPGVYFQRTTPLHMMSQIGPKK